MVVPKRRWRTFIFGLALLPIVLVGSARTAYAGANYMVGHISRVTFVSNYLLFMLDVPLPTNCTGSPSSWMMVPVTNAAMQAFVLGLWMRGDAASIPVVVYTVS